ncbi:MAG: 4Fe-4S dicluster domain-containing protein [Acidobacteriota bacterium]
MEKKLIDIEEKLGWNKYKVDETAHLKIKEPSICIQKCTMKQCTYCCPAKCYTQEEDKVVLSYEGCLECGTCRVVCWEFDNIEWKYPRGGFGVCFNWG